MNLFRKKTEIDTEEKFKQFFQEVNKRSFSIKLKKKDEEGKTVSSQEYDVIKLSTLNRIIETHFGYSNKNNKIVTREHNEEN